MEVKIYMKRGIGALALALILALLAACGAEASRLKDAEVQLFAVNVGKGDALILKAGDCVCLIDTGKAKAMGGVRRALAQMGVDVFQGSGARLDAVFITHTDSDHADGLTWLADSALCAGLTVDNWYAPAMYTGVKADKHPAVKAAGDRVQWLKRGDVIPLGDTGAVLRVLAPASLYRDKDDNNSLVMMLESSQGNILLTGDMELPEETELLLQGDDLRCAVLKVPNHGDDDTTSAAFASACAAQLAVISTDSREKPGTPDPGVVSRLQRAGSQVIVTEGSGLGVLVTLRDGVAAAGSVDFGAEELSGVSIAEVDASNDRVVLRNDADGAVQLGGCYLYSDRGDELFVIPDGASIEPDGTLVIGTNSTEGGYDVLWDDKKVVHRKKSDVIYLYDSWGRIIDSLDNGL